MATAVADKKAPTKAGAKIVKVPSTTKKETAPLKSYTPQELATEIEKFGVQTEPYQRGPLGSAIFAISLTALGTRDFLRLWCSDIHKVALYGDKKLTQVVLHVREEKRSISRKVSWTQYEQNMGASGPSKAQLEANARNRFNVAGLPTSTRYTYKAIKSEPAKNHPGAGGYGNYTYQVTATVPATNQYFLIGKDEESYFICLLPKACTSVEAAHKALRPAGLSKNAVRQGEWFFDPAPAADQAILDRLIKGKRVTNQSSAWSQPRKDSYCRRALEAGSSHSAPGLYFDDELYVHGTVRDSRKRHHKPLELKGWHKAVRNLEAQPPPQQRTRSRRWD